VSKLSERQRLIVTIAVTVLITGGLLALILNDRGEIDLLEDEIASLDSRIRAADLEIRKTRAREDRVLVFRAVEERELAVLPTQQRIAAFHRNLSTFLASSSLYFVELPESTPVESELAKGIYVTRSTLTCRGDAAALIKFINIMENDPRLVAIKGFRVQAGQKDRNNPDEPVLHDIELHLETYFYNPKAGATERVHVPNSEARLQDDEALREAIASFQPERPDTYVLRPSTSRRDPLVDPRRARPTLDPEELAAAWRREETVVLDLENRIDEINENVEKELALLRAGDLFRRDRLAGEIDLLLNDVRARLVQVDQMKTVTIPDLVLRVQQVTGRAEEVASRRTPRDLTVPRSVAESQLAKVQERFDVGDYSEVMSLAAAWTQYVQGKQIDPDARAYSEEIAVLRARAKVLSDFQTVTIQISGMIVNERHPERSVVLVNGRPRRIGDAIDGSDEVVVGGIDATGVDFVYKGETIRVHRRRTGVRRAAPSGTASLDTVNAVVEPGR
jgi:hypothetical protein